MKFYFFDELAAIAAAGQQIIRFLYVCVVEAAGSHVVFQGL